MMPGSISRAMGPMWTIEAFRQRRGTCCAWMVPAMELTCWPSWACGWMYNHPYPLITSANCHHKEEWRKANS